MQTQHMPVMLEEVLKFLRPAPGGHYIDGTIGGGGHTEAILERTAPDGKVLGIDTDVQALARVREQLAESVSNGRLVLAHGNFAELARIVNEAGFMSIQGILLDLGFSSHQMDNPERGFSPNVLCANGQRERLRTPRKLRGWRRLASLLSLVQYTRRQKRFKRCALPSIMN